MFGAWYLQLGFNACSNDSVRRTARTAWARRISTVCGSLRDVQILVGHLALRTIQQYIEADAGTMKRVVEFPMNRNAVVFSICCINIALYFLMQSNYHSFSFSSQQVYEFGGMYNDSIDDGEYYRLVASTYIHFNPIHIISNLAALIAWGSAVSERVSTWRFILLYTLSGIIGNLGHYCFIK